MIGNKLAYRYLSARRGLRCWEAVSVGQSIEVLSTDGTQRIVCLRLSDTDDCNASQAGSSSRKVKGRLC